MPNLRNGSTGDSNPGSLDCESSIMPLSYRAIKSMLMRCHGPSGTDHADRFSGCFGPVSAQAVQNLQWAAMSTSMLGHHTWMLRSTSRGLFRCASRAEC